MCGIAGFFVTKKVSDEAKALRFKIMTKLFDELQSRGTDASGFSYINEYGNLVTVKGPVTSKKMVTDPKWLKLADKQPTSLIVHCRAMTTGSQMDNFNNHPLVVNKEYAVVHNGMISNHLELKSKHSLAPKGQVDSEVIPLLISKYASKYAKKSGVDTKAISKAINRTGVELTGGFACAMLNKQTPDALYLFTHTNPTYLAYSEELGCVFFASTDDLLSSAFDIEDNSKKVFGIFTKRLINADIKEIADNTITVLKRDFKDGNPEPEVSIVGYALDTSYSSKNWDAVAKAYVIKEEAFAVLVVKNPTEDTISTKTGRMEDWQQARAGGSCGYGTGAWGG